MGICPTLRGKDITRRPDGLYSPEITSAIPCPPSLPGNQAWRIASNCESSHDKSSGRPLNTIRAMGFPVSFNAFNSCRCASGNRISLRQAASPDQLKSSPTATSTTSELRAAETACAMLAGLDSVIVQP